MIPEPDNLSERAGPGRRGWWLQRVLPLMCVMLGSGLAFLMDATICPLAGVFGIPCPSCGLTRASLALLEGELQRAQGIHPCVLPVWFYLGLAVLTLMRRPESRPRAPLAILGLLLLFALFSLWIARFAGALGGPVAVERW